jgi:CheY-like chemotaxis protein
MSTILLVDDEQDVLDLFTQVLELMDHRVLGARDGREALSIARELRPDLVVTDWNMPRMTGLELCHELHADERLSGIPIILHSTAGNPHVPGVQFVPKSCALEEFEALVTRLLVSTRSQREFASHSREGSRAPPSIPSRPPHTERRSFRFEQEGEAACSTAH